MKKIIMKTYISKLHGSNLVKQEIQEAKGKITRIMTLIDLSNFKIRLCRTNKPEYIKIATIIYKDSWFNLY